MDKGLILGTANFGNKYGISGGLDKHQCFDILDAAWDLGIRWLDTARSYGESEIIIGTYRQHEFKIISKGDSNLDRALSYLLLTRVDKYLYHHYDEKTTYIPTFFDGVSVYNTKVKIVGSFVHFPLNLFDQRFRFIKRCLRIARSIFMQGQAFKMPDIMGIPFYHLCWNFVRNHTNVDMMCFGVDSVKQLEDIMKIPQYEIDYTKIGSGEQWIKSVV